MVKNNITKILFIIYFILLVWIVLFKTSFSFSEINSFRSINLIPFYYENEVSFHSKEVIYNTIIFAPLGIFLKMYNKKNKDIILDGFVLSLLFEISQFIFQIGASDITDIITNTLGTIIGVLIYNFLSRFIKDKIKLNIFINIVGVVLLSSFLILAIIIMLFN